MMSSRLRTWISFISLGILFGGPLVVVLSGVMSGFESPSDFGRIIGVVIRNAALFAALGGILRLLVSIDARLEAKE